jgi:dTDP-4-amino-4,6-dideoxygalactose transaminase
MSESDPIIPFNRPYTSERDVESVTAAVQSRRLCGDGPFTLRAQRTLEERYGYPKVLLTPSCTDALELAALLCSISPGDEVIVPTYTFVSTANAFRLRGATLKFADSLAQNPNIAPAEVERLISPRTRAIVVVHYAGICCEMNALCAIAERHGVALIEDAAQAIDSYYLGRPAGSFGRFAAFSFHETKNVTCGEGGAIVLNRPEDVSRAEIMRDKGTNRAAFMRGEVDRYAWVDIGSSYLPSELSAALLCSQFQQIENIQARRQNIFEQYDGLLRNSLSELGIQCPQIPQECVGNAHIYYIVLPDANIRETVRVELLKRRITTTTHYGSLHRSPYFSDKYESCELRNADRFADGLLRLPLYFELTASDITYVAENVLDAITNVPGRARRSMPAVRAR